MIPLHHTLLILTSALLTAGITHAAPIQIGLLTDLTGKAAYLGQHVRIGAEIARDEINKEGGELTLLFQDHGMDPARAVTGAQKLLNIDHVDAIYSTFSGTSRAASPIAKSAGKIFVYAAAAVSPATDNPTAFKSYLDYEHGCRGIAQTWKSFGVRSVGVLKADSEFGELCERGVKAVYPEARSISYKIGEDVATPALLFKSQGIEAIANAGLEGDMVNMLKAFQRIQYAPRIGANEDIFTEKVRKEFADLMPKVRVFGMPRPNESFIQQVLARDSKKEVQSFDSAGMAYLHIRQMYAALSKCGADVTVSCQTQALMSAPPDPKLGFEKWGDDRRAIYKDTQYDLVTSQRTKG